MEIKELLYMILHTLVLPFKNLKKKYFSVYRPDTYILSDKSFIKTVYKNRTGKKLNLKKPQTLVEKMQWLKVYNRKPVYTTMVDKYLARYFIADKIGENYLVPMLGVWDNAADIDFASLPDKYVLKCNHTSDVVIVKNGSAKTKSGVILDSEEKIRSFLDNQLKFDYYKAKREWPYKNVKRKIICEKFIENADGSELVDYKFYCYGGKLQYFMYSLGEAEHNVRNHKFDVNCNSIDYKFKEKPAISAEDIKLPENINEMIEIANIFGAGEPHLRVDMYNVDGEIYIGELTFYSSSGFINIYDKEYAQSIADLIDIKKIKRNSRV